MLLVEDGVPVALDELEFDELELELELDELALELELDEVFVLCVAFHSSRTLLKSTVYAYMPP